MRAAAAVLLLSACAAPLPPGVERVSYLGRTYEVRAVASEPSPDLASPALVATPDGGRVVPPDLALDRMGPVVRVAGAASRQGASDAAALFCAARGLDVAPGWRGAPVRFDDATAEHVFYVGC